MKIQYKDCLEKYIDEEEGDFITEVKPSISIYTYPYMFKYETKCKCNLCGKKLYEEVCQCPICKSYDIVPVDHKFKRKKMGTTEKLSCPYY